MRDSNDETIDVGFFRSLDNPRESWVGRLVRDAGDQLWAVLIKSCDNGTPTSVRSAAQSETWLFQGEKALYVLLGVRGGLRGQRIPRSNLLGGFEKFLRQQFSAEAVFRAREPLAISGKKNPYSAMSRNLMFDALSLTSGSLAFWIGLKKDVGHDVEWPPKRPQRKDHPICMSSVGKLSIYTGGETDSAGESARIRDTLSVDFGEPRTFDFAYRTAGVVRDFVNLTIGESVPMALTAFSRECAKDRHLVREFRLVPQSQRFCPHRQFSDSIRSPMLTLDNVGGLSALATLLNWCNDDKLNETILYRTVHQWKREEAFAQYWRILNMIHGGSSEKKRIMKFVDDVGELVVKSVLPEDVDVECWSDAIRLYRNKVITHPSRHVVLDSRMYHQGPVFTNQMEFLLKAYVMKMGAGIELSEGLRDSLRYSINGLHHWDWRQEGETYPLY